MRTAGSGSAVLHGRWYPVSRFLAAFKWFKAAVRDLQKKAASVNVPTPRICLLACDHWRTFAVSFTKVAAASSPSRDQENKPPSPRLLTYAALVAITTGSSKLQNSVPL